MQYHLDLWSFKVDNNTITLTVIHKYTDVCKKYPEQSSQVADWCDSGEWLNRQKVRMPNIACDDASTHGKFIILSLKVIFID